MATDATGTPTSLGIPTYDPDNDAPSGLGFNAAMASIDGLFKTRVTTGAGVVWQNKLLTADANPAFRILGSGYHQWGAGGASAVDTDLFRLGVGVLATSGSFKVNAYTLSNLNGGISIDGRLTIGDNILYLGNAGDTSLTRQAAGSASFGSAAPVSAPVLSVLGEVGGHQNQLEWGNANNGGFRNTLGNDNASGQAFIAFYGEHGTNASTYRTRGVPSSIIQPDATGGFQFGTTAAINTDNQAFANKVSITGAGAVAASTEVLGRYGSATQVGIGAVGPGSASGISFQSAEFSLYRYTTATLATDASFYVANTSVTAFQVASALLVDANHAKVVIGATPANFNGNYTLGIQNTNSVPGTPTAGGSIYVESGALKYKGSSGTITVIAPA